MNIFEKQKLEKNTKLETLEEMRTAIEELKKLENQMQETAKNLNIKHNILTSHLDALDISKISKTISANEDRIDNQITKLEKTVLEFKDKIHNEAQKNINSYVKNLLYFIYFSIAIFVIILGFTTYTYYKNITQLEDKINSVYWILAEDQKFWYDKESQQFFIKDYEWIKNYKKNLQNKN